MNTYERAVCFSHVIIQGKVCYDDGSPVKGAMIIIEEYHCCNKDCECNMEACKLVSDSEYTITDSLGSFYIIIYNAKHYYKIRVFDAMRKQCSLDTHSENAYL